MICLWVLSAGRGHGPLGTLHPQCGEIKFLDSLPCVLQMPPHPGAESVCPFVRLSMVAISSVCFGFLLLANEGSGLQRG